MVACCFFLRRLLDDNWLHFADNEVIGGKYGSDLFDLLDRNLKVVSILEDELIEDHIAEPSVEAAEQRFALPQHCLGQTHQLVAKFDHLVPLLLSPRLSVVCKLYNHFAPERVCLLLGFRLLKKLLGVDA